MYEYGTCWEFQGPRDKSWSLRGEDAQRVRRDQRVQRGQGDSRAPWLSIFWPFEVELLMTFPTIQSIWMNWLFQVFRKQKRLTTSSFWQKVDWPLVNVDKWPSEFELGPRYNPRGPPGGPPLRELMISQWWLGAKGQDKAWEGQRWRCANSRWRPGCCRVGLKMPMLKKWRPPFAWLERDFWQLLSILAIFMYQLQWRISRVVGTPQEWIWNVGELPVCRTSVMELVMCC